MPKKKVLFLLKEYPQISETYIETELNAVWDKYQIKIISLLKPNLTYEHHRPYDHIPLTDKETLIAAIRGFGPDVVHGHYILMCPVLRDAARIAEAGFTVRAHSFDILGPSTRDIPKYREIINGPSCLGVLTFPYTIPLLERAGIRSDKIRGCYPVMDFQRFHDESPNGDAIMNVGACIPKKNMEEYLILSKIVKDKTFNLYALGYNVEALRTFSRKLDSPVNFVDQVEPGHMPPEYKRHQWLVYTASHNLRTVGWPMAVAEAQAAGVGACVQNIRPDLREYVGEAGFLFDTAHDAAKIISQSFPDELRQIGFEQARKSDIRGHIHKLENLWNRAG